MKENKIFLVVLYIISMVLLIFFNNICNEYGISSVHRILLIMLAGFSYELGKPIYSAVYKSFNKKEDLIK